MGGLIKEYWEFVAEYGVGARISRAAGGGSLPGLCAGTLDALRGEAHEQAAAILTADPQRTEGNPWQPRAAGTDAGGGS